MTSAPTMHCTAKRLSAVLYSAKPKPDSSRSTAAQRALRERLDAASDIAEQSLKVAAEVQHGGDAQDCDEAEDEAVFGEALTLLVVAQRVERGDVVLCERLAGVVE